MYKELITQLHIYACAIRILAKGCLTISIITPIKLKEIPSMVKNTVRKTNPDYDLASTIRILAKGCIPISIITPMKLKEILSMVKTQSGKQIQIMIWSLKVYIYIMI